MQIGLRQGLINAALIGAKGTAALQHQCDPLERRALSRDMGLAQQRLMAGHHGSPLPTVRWRLVETMIPVLKALNAVSRAALVHGRRALADASNRASVTLAARMARSA